VCMQDFKFNDASLTRGHPYKLYKRHSHSSVRTSRTSYFAVRVINVWNALRANRADFSSFAAFKWLYTRLIYQCFYYVITFISGLLLASLALKYSSNMCIA